MQLFQTIKCIGVFKSLGLLLFFFVVFRQQSSLVSLTIFKFNFIPFLFNLRYNQLVQTLAIKENVQLTEISSHKVKLSPTVSFHDFKGDEIITASTNYLGKLPLCYVLTRDQNGKRLECNIFCSYHILTSSVILT